MSQLVIQHYTRPERRRPLWIGIVMAVVATVFAIEQLILWLGSTPSALHGVQVSLLAGLATGLGAIPVLFLRRPREHWVAPMLGMAGGMMLAASLFSLLMPAIGLVAASEMPWVLALSTAIALMAGAGLMHAVDARTRHVHAETLSATVSPPRLGLVVAAIALHNLPEGFAVGMAAAAGVDHGLSLGIAIQNIPEGWIVASAMLLLGIAPWQAALLALGTGLMEPAGGIIGVMAGSLGEITLPLALAGAAGAMLWVVSHELIPASHRPGREAAGTAGLAVGFAVMTVVATLS